MKKSKKKIVEKTVNIVMAGIENSGKTSILNAIKGIPISDVSKTNGFDISNIKMKKKYLNIYDLGGSKDQRHFWNCYIDSCDALIYVIDGSDEAKFEEAGKWLNYLLEEVQLEDVPVAIFVNKLDRKNWVGLESVIEGFGFEDIDDREWEVFEVSAKSGKGILDGFEWLYKEVSN